MCVCVHLRASVSRLCVCVCVFVWCKENKWDHYLGRGQNEWAKETLIILLFDKAETMLICFVPESDGAVPDGY